MILPAPNWPGYLVGDDGSVYSEQRGKRKRLKAQRRGNYLVVRLYKDGRSQQVAVHHLVLQAFVGPRPKGRQASHTNDVGTDNRLCNLSWETPARNQELRRINGGVRKGEEAPSARLTEENVLEIRRDASAATPEEFAARFGVHRRTVLDVIEGKTWKHLLAPTVAPERLT